jgi:hypothetical protein
MSVPPQTNKKVATPKKYALSAITLRELGELLSGLYVSQIYRQFDPGCGNNLSQLDRVVAKAHSKAKTTVKKIAKTMKRTEGAVRQKGFALGIPLGHRR